MLYFARWKIFAIVATVLVGLAFLAPNFLSPATADALPSWLPHKHRPKKCPVWL